MEIVAATGTVVDPGPLTKVALRWAQGVEERATGGAVSADEFEALSDCVAVDEFKRVGAYLEEQTWQEYLQFMAQWASGTRFETTVLHIAEVGNAVFKQIEERHYHGDQVVRKNVMAVYRFNEHGKIKRLDIYEQAEDSGQWIVRAAKEATRESSSTPGK